MWQPVSIEGLPAACNSQGSRSLFSLGMVVCVLAAIPIRAQNREQLLIYGVTGSDNSGVYSLTMSKVAVQKLLLEMAASPRTSDFLDAALKDTGVTREGLEALGLVRRQGDNCVITPTR